MFNFYRILLLACFIAISFLTASKPFQKVEEAITCQSSLGIDYILELMIAVMILIIGFFFNAYIQDNKEKNKQILQRTEETSNKLQETISNIAERLAELNYETKRAREVDSNIQKEVKIISRSLNKIRCWIHDHVNIHAKSDKCEDSNKYYSD